MLRQVSVPLLGGLVVADLIGHACGLHPVMDVTRLGEPEWVKQTIADPNSRFYVGGKLGGSLDSMDFDSSRAFLSPQGLAGSASRASLNIQAAYYPSSWGGREMLSYDLPVLWPQAFYAMTKRFEAASREQRDRFLDRTAVRYRIVPQRRA